MSFRKDDSKVNYYGLNLRRLTRKRITRINFDINWKKPKIMFICTQNLLYSNFLLIISHINLDKFVLLASKRDRIYLTGF